MFRATLRTIYQHDANKRINDERKVASPSTSCTVALNLEERVTDKNRLMEALNLASSVQNQYKGTWSEPCVLSLHRYIFKIYFTMQKSNVCCAKLVDNVYLCEGFEG